MLDDLYKTFQNLIIVLQIIDKISPKQQKTYKNCKLGDDNGVNLVYNGEVFLLML